MRTIDPVAQAAKRRVILDAAAACFAAKGLHGTRTADICARAGMSSGNVFHYFASKHAIVAALVEREGVETAAALAELTAFADPIAALFRLLDGAIAIAADPAAASLALDLAAEALRDPEIGALCNRNDLDLRVATADLLRRARAADRVDPALDPDDAATWVAALIDGLFSRVASDPAFDPAAQAANLRLMVTRFLRIDEA
ncbi:TetR/AcrR family transcriptional regulator [Embleya sp. NBC_00896]|uniref:TetR/AcrR family transcriptional regulator n=1 Tax=Embleya sp. NBC_00896 TaxID=2975961 RepID=UPI00386F8A5A|nr:TetR/AcrR family transcriptional regulator [Embleya sp. NBC_00896]